MKKKQAHMPESSDDENALVMAKGGAMSKPKMKVMNKGESEKKKKKCKHQASYIHTPK
jgi:hypothetical protein